MAAESIISFKRPGFPKENASAAGRATFIEYIGPESTLRAASPATGATWGDYSGLVQDVDVDPIEGTDHAVLAIRILREWGSAEYGSSTGDEQQTVHEIDWVDVQTDIFQHKVFRASGTYALNNDDLIELRRWQDMTDITLKAAWQFYTDDTGEATGTLSANAQVLAKGLLLGIEYYNEKAPVLRKSTFYLNGPPPQSGGGVKEDPGSFPQISGLSGYEWLRSADRSLQTGTEKEWRRDQEWTGARKILVDAENIYWLP